MTFSGQKVKRNADFENINAHTYFYFIFILSSAKDMSRLTADVFMEGLTRELNI